MTTKTTFLDPEEIRRRLAMLGDATPPERATFVCGMAFVLDENGNQHLRLAMQGNISFEKLTNCLYNAIREAMKDFMESRVPSDVTMQ